MKAACALLAFHGTPLETLDEDHAEEVFAGAMLVASAIDDIRTTRLHVENYMKALAKRGKR